MRIFSFLLLEILLAPLTLSSLILLQLWTLTVSKQQQTSLTALAPLFFRWLLHIQGIRPDETTERLIDALPSLNTALCWGAVGPTLLAANLTGYTPSFLGVPASGEEDLGNMIHTRSLFFDTALTQYLATAEQVVLLGAGYDTRLFKFCSGLNLSLFEVDKRATQQAKIKALKKSGIDLSEVAFVEVDFETEDWAEALQKLGFESSKRSFFLWEGVTYYLTEKAVRESLLKVTEMSAVGSAIAFDVFSPTFVSARSEWQWIQPAISLLKLVGEPFRFGINLQDQSFVEQLLETTGLQIESFQTMGMLRGSAFSGLVVAEKS